MINRISEHIVRIIVRLPGNPLKYTNSYLITGNKRNLLVDTGFNLPVSLEDMKAGLEEINADMTKTDIFLTHFHADHTGLVPKITNGDSKVYISHADKKHNDWFLMNREKSWNMSARDLIKEGYERKAIETVKHSNPMFEFVPERFFDTIAVSDRQTLDLGGIALQTILTPGHTPGHMCLYDPKEEILLTGDHVLFDITPNITSWTEMPDALGTYLDSLKKIQHLKVKTALPGHREFEGSFSGRVDELLFHHEVRLKEIIEILQMKPDQTCYEIASGMKWSIRAENWDDFPQTQKWFAIGEAKAHVMHLITLGIVSVEEINSVNHYALV